MRALVFILGILLLAFPAKNVDVVVVFVVPPMPKVSPDVDESQEWALFHAESFSEHADAFEAYFNAIEFKRAKNGAPMVRRPGDKTFKFVKKG